jgi:transposase-like protein
MHYRDTVHSARVTGVYTEATERVVVPKTCPFCNSVDITTTSKTVDASTYWRCTACGQIWNAGRMQHGRPTPSRRFA